MKIYTFDGKKKIVDNCDFDSSPLYMGRKFISSSRNKSGGYDAQDTAEAETQNEDTDDI